MGKTLAQLKAEQKAGTITERGMKRLGMLSGKTASGGGKGLLTPPGSLKPGGKQPYQTAAQGQIAGNNNYITAQGQNMASAGLDQAGQNLSKPYDPSNLYDVGQGKGTMQASNKFYQSDPNQLVQGQQQQMYNNQMALLKPQMDQQKEDFEQMAAERGWTPGSEVYQRQKQALADDQSRTMLQAQNQAYDQANSSLNTMNNIYGQGAATSIGAGGNLYNNQYQADMNQRYQPLSDVSQINGAMQPYYTQQNNEANRTQDIYKTNLQGKYGNINAATSASGQVRAAGAQAAGGVTSAGIYADATRDAAAIAAQSRGNQY